MRQTALHLARSYRRDQRALQDFFNEGPWRPHLVCLPEQSMEVLGAGATTEALVVTAPGSWLTALSGSSSNAAGFRVQIVEAETRESLFSTPVLFSNVTGQDSGTGFTQPLHLFRDPWLTLSGRIRVQMRNLAGTSNTVQLVLWMAVPE